MDNPLLLTDFYKTIHHKAYIEGLEYLTSYWTPRMTRKDNMDKVVMFGLQSFIQKYLIDYFDERFFSRGISHVITEYRNIISQTMGEDNADTEHIKALHDLGYLPIKISAVPEGTRVPIKVPMIEITNTVKGFGWLVNYLETFMSCHVWQPMTSATIAYRYRQIINKYYDLTVDNGLKQKACGDFSMRGMSCLESAESSSAGHLLSFSSTATIPAIEFLNEYYNDGYNKYYEYKNGFTKLLRATKDLKYSEIATGTPSTEHSVMCSYGEDELTAYKRLITEVFPKGVLSIVSDTYDYWNLITNILSQLKEDIMNRDGKIVIRGDSGDPVKIICGDIDAPKDSPEHKGTVELLWEIFGGEVNSKGFKVLDPHIGTIYGDSITVERCETICANLVAKGFAVNNMVFGVGSYTYQYNTRDTFGFALKATHAVINGEERFIFKAPKTDTGNFKKSQKGLCFVGELNGTIYCKDELTINQREVYRAHAKEVMIPVFKDGSLLNKTNLREIRDRLHKGEF